VNELASPVSGLLGAGIGFRFAALRHTNEAAEKAFLAADER